MISSLQGGNASIWERNAQELSVHRKQVQLRRHFKTSFKKHFLGKSFILQQVNLDEVNILFFVLFQWLEIISIQWRKFFLLIMLWSLTSIFQFTSLQVNWENLSINNYYVFLLFKSLLENQNQNIKSSSSALYLYIRHSWYLILCWIFLVG